MPHGDQSRRAARRAAANCHDVLLYLPMDPLGVADPGLDAVRVSDDAREISRKLLADLDAVLGAIGVNNRMGSNSPPMAMPRIDI